LASETSDGIIRSTSGFRMIYKVNFLSRRNRCYRCKCEGYDTVDQGNSFEGYSPRMSIEQYWWPCSRIFNRVDWPSSGLTYHPGTRTGSSNISPSTALIAGPCRKPY